MLLADGVPPPTDDEGRGVPPGGTDGMTGCGAWLVPLGQLGPVLPGPAPPRPEPMAVEPPIGPPGATPCASVVQARIRMPAIVAVAMVGGCFGSFVVPAMGAYLPSLVKDEADLGPANTVYASLDNIALVVGPAIAGIFLAVTGSYGLGTSVLYLIDAKNRQLAVYEARGGSPDMRRKLEEAATVLCILTILKEANPVSI